MQLAYIESKSKLEMKEEETKTKKKRQPIKIIFDKKRWQD